MRCRSCGWSHSDPGSRLSHRATTAHTKAHTTRYYVGKVLARNAPSLYDQGMRVSRMDHHDGMARKSKRRSAQVYDRFSCRMKAVLVWSHSISQRTNVLACRAISKTSLDIPQDTHGAAGSNPSLFEAEPTSPLNAWDWQHNTTRTS